jgi:drug/metabolite transporter (DMT)-like permease
LSHKFRQSPLPEDSAVAEIKALLDHLIFHISLFDIHNGFYNLGTNMHISSYGILAAVSWAVADIFIAQSTKTVRPVIAAALVNLIGAILFALYYLLFIRQQIPANFVGLAWSSLAGLCIALASAFFFIALHKGPIGIVSALSSTYPAITLAVALSIFGANIHSAQVLGFLMVIIGVVGTAGLHSHNTGRNAGTGLGTWPALAAALLWGIGYGFLAEGVNVLGWEAASAVQFIVLAVSCLVFLLVLLRKESQTTSVIKASLRNWFIMGAAVAQQFGAIFLNVGLSGDVTGGSITVALSACYPVLTTIMAFYIFKERIHIFTMIAGAVAIAGIVILSL